MEFIALANAHVTQHTRDNVKTDWSVEENKTDNKLGTLPSNLKENEVFQILDWARKYELIAFNVGIDYGKKQQKAINEDTMSKLTTQVSQLAQENERLANLIEKYTNNN